MITQSKAKQSYLLHRNSKHIDGPPAENSQINSRGYNMITQSKAKQSYLLHPTLSFLFPVLTPEHATEMNLPPKRTSGYVQLSVRPYRETFLHRINFGITDRSTYISLRFLLFLRVAGHLKVMLPNQGRKAAWLGRLVHFPAFARRLQVFFSVDSSIILHVATADIGGTVIILVIVMLLLLEKLKKSPLLLFNQQRGLWSAVYRYPPTERRLSITITIWGAASRWSEILKKKDSEHMSRIQN
jgi:hypothetical protein